MDQDKGDFTVDFRLVGISVLAVLVGVLCAFVAVALLDLIAFFTNLFYFQRVSLGEARPDQNTLGWLSVFIPVAGGLIIGLLARYGSERIRGHGIPEAMEAILIGQSRMQPKVAVLKPLSSAISIGSGGPFGAEGPIIMTGGAFGSIIAQVFQMSAAERKTLLVAGAAGGMAATFATPVAAVLLAVELLLFEWKPRSLVPVAIASAVAAMIRPYLRMGAGPLFPVGVERALPGVEVLGCAALVGLLAGVLSLLLTLAVYAAEDAFHRLPIHWMWWPALGGLVVGVGGYFEPKALGVGYDIIGQLLHGDYHRPALVGLIVVKAAIWAIALGSGTSGGVLAPLLIMGGALGALLGGFLPAGDAALWPLVSMAAVMGGTMRSPLTGAVFALELTQDIKVLPALLLASVFSYAFTALVMKRSILTEKVARRGFHVSREYSVDPLELLSVGDVMATDLVTIAASAPLKRIVTEFFLGSGKQRHQGYPVVDAQGQLLGVITKASLLENWVAATLKGEKPADLDNSPIIAYDLIQGQPVTVFAWESCRAAAQRMAQAGVGRLPVVSREDPKRLLGIITRSDLLKPRARQAEEEMRRERFIDASRWLPIPRRPS
jgi:H+/Cl- antiporter ClcA